MKDNQIIARLRIAMKNTGINQAKLAKAVGVSPQAVGRWFKNGVIGKDSLILAAKATNVTAGWLLNGDKENPNEIHLCFKDEELKAIDAIASELGISTSTLLHDALIEGLNKNPDRREIKPNLNDIQITNATIPLISWEQARTLSKLQNISDIEQHYPCPEKHSAKTFALTVRGESMSPDFIDGEIIFVDPDVEAINSSCVVVLQSDDTEPTFKQLVFDGNTKYLKSLNPNWPEQFVKMLPGAAVCGVVISSYRARI